MTNSVSDLETAEWLFEKIISLRKEWRKKQKIFLVGEQKEPNLEEWANEIKLMRAVDGITDKEIRSLFDWADKDDDFLHVNILSPQKLRKHLEKLIIISKTKS